MEYKEIFQYERRQEVFRLEPRKESKTKPWFKTKTKIKKGLGTFSLREFIVMQPYFQANETFRFSSISVTMVKK